MTVAALAGTKVFSYEVEDSGTGGSMLAEGTIGQEQAGHLELLLSDSSKGYDLSQTRTDVASRELELEDGNMYTSEIESFSASIQEDYPVEVPLDDALQVQ